MAGGFFSYLITGDCARSATSNSLTHYSFSKKLMGRATVDLVAVTHTSDSVVAKRPALFVSRRPVAWRAQEMPSPGMLV